MFLKASADMPRPGSAHTAWCAGQHRVSGSTLRPRQQRRATVGH
uniref:Uncharacterized protein n=1 Tax=Anguilla anguilla TaxID=7936 RepID=A0A0E9XBW5_ANGAN